MDANPPKKSQWLHFFSEWGFVPPKITSFSDEFHNSKPISSPILSDIDLASDTSQFTSPPGCQIKLTCAESGMDSCQ